VAAVALLAFGVVSGAALVAFGLWQALRRRYRDRFGVTREGGAAVRAGLLVAVIGACEIAIAAFMYVASR
jgi:hypothetical protein